LKLDDELLEAAATLDPSVLRTLDAVHLASAKAAGTDLDCVVTYDRRMSRAAGALGVTVRSPGTRLVEAARR
jgi:predicted nucleic acid-binding protein